KQLSELDLSGLRVVELGCGLGVPSVAAARAGAAVLATDMDPDALELAARHAGEHGLELAAIVVSWASPDELVERGPFDLVLGTDVLYERQSVALLLNLLPRLASEAWIAEPGRPAAEPFLEQARSRWKVETHARGVVQVHRIRMD